MLEQMENLIIKIINSGMSEAWYICGLEGDNRKWYFCTILHSNNIFIIYDKHHFDGKDGEGVMGAYIANNVIHAMKQYFASIIT